MEKIIYTSGSGHTLLDEYDPAIVEPDDPSEAANKRLALKERILAELIRNRGQIEEAIQIATADKDLARRDFIDSLNLDSQT